MTAPDTTIFARDLIEATALRELLYATDAGDWQAGSAEPWVRNIVGALVQGNNAQHAVEIGAFQGYTTLEIAYALAGLPGPRRLSVCEIDEARAQDVLDKLQREQLDNVDVAVYVKDSHAWIPTLPDASVDFVWLDGNHERHHVMREIALLLPKMRPGGLIVGHDVFGVCNLQEVFAFYGGYSLDLPRLGPAGGIGILQVR